MEGIGGVLGRPIFRRRVNVGLCKGLMSDDSHTRALLPWNFTGFTIKPLVFGAFQGCFYI